MSNTWQEFNDANEPDVGDEIVVVVGDGGVCTDLYADNGKLSCQLNGEISQWVHKPKPAVREFDINVDGVRVQYDICGLLIDGFTAHPDTTRVVLKLLEERKGE